MNTLRRLPGAVTFVLRGAVTSVIGNLSLAVLALALALSLWLYVTDKENPEESRTFSSPIAVEFVNVPNDLAVSSTSAASVRIRIEGPRNELDDLRVDDFNATVDLGGLQRGTQSVLVDVSSTDASVNVIAITPPRIDVTLEAARTKEVPVRVALVGSPQSGFAAVEERVEPATVTVRGPESLVELVDAVLAEINLTGSRVDITDERVPLEPRDERGGQISRVVVNPATAAVSVEIEQREFSQQFTVTAQIAGQPADGYNITAIEVDPRIVTIAAPLDVLESLDAVGGIPTEEISLADARDDVIRTVALVLPDEARVDGSDTVHVTVRIDPAQGELTFQVAPQVRNVASNLALTIAEPVRVTLSGEVPVLQGISPASIVISVNAEGLGPGLYALPLEITTPVGATVVRVEPAQLGIALTERP